jgi:hypothetical protein
MHSPEVARQKGEELMSLRLWLVLGASFLLWLLPGASAAQSTEPSSPPAAFKPEELERIVALVALYPDALLAQVFMAATYPVEVVQADRWLKQNQALKDSPDELNKLTWDPSVKSLTDFPQVLAMMSEKLDWTVNLGDAFIADEKSVMVAVQRLRGKAHEHGNLNTTAEQKVIVAAQTPTHPQVIVIESPSRQSCTSRRTTPPLCTGRGPILRIRPTTITRRDM